MFPDCETNCQLHPFAFSYIHFSYIHLLSYSFLFGCIVRGQTGKPHPQDPSNPRKRIYKVFDRIEDTRSDETIQGTGLSGSARVPQNKAHRFNVSSVIQTKLANTAPSLNDLFGAPANGPPEKKEKKQKKALSEEEQAKKDFDKDMQQTLVENLFGRIQS